MVRMRSLMDSLIQSVKRRKRLVKEQKARLHHQRSRQRHALLLTAGKLLHAAFKMRLESQ